MISDFIAAKHLDRLNIIQRHDRKKFLAGMFVGGLLGTVAGVLLAPKSGEETREDLKSAAKDAKEKLIDTKDDLKEKGKDLIEDVQENHMDAKYTEIPCSCDENQEKKEDNSPEEN